MLSKTVLALALGAASAMSNDEYKDQFDNFKIEYGRTYASPEEESYRFEVFKANLVIAAERNAEDTAEHGVTRFSDLTPAEFKSSFTNYVPLVGLNRTYDETIEDLPAGVDALVDWTSKYNTPVKNQGYCGSCWAFSAGEQIESDYKREYGVTQVLSMQQLTSCTGGGTGCNGGWTESAFTYAKRGLETESDYPYTSGAAGVTGTCKASSSKYVVKVTSYHTVSSSSAGESKMASYVGSTGPLSVCVDANSWSSYRSGVMSSCGKSVDHCVQAVGINTAAGYWKVRNSWGTSWGESGFIRLSYGSNTCAIASDANYASTAKY